MQTATTQRPTNTELVKLLQRASRSLCEGGTDKSDKRRMRDNDLASDLNIAVMKIVGTDAVSPTFEERVQWAAAAMFALVQPSNLTAIQQWEELAEVALKAAGVR